MKKIEEWARKAIKLGFVHIFTVKTLGKILSLLSSVVIVRLLNKSDYGIYSYAFNIVTYLTIFSGLGLSGSFLQYGCEAESGEDRWILTRALGTYGLIANALFAVGTLAYVLFVPLSVPAGKWALVGFAFLPACDFLFEFLSTHFRIQLENKKYAVITNVQTMCYFVLTCLGGYWFGLPGAIAGRYAGYVIAIIVGLSISKGFLRNFLKEKLIRLKDCKEYIRFGLFSVLCSGLGGMLGRVSLFVVGIICGTTVSIAEYQTAAVLPNAIGFVPQTLLIFVYPYFVAHRMDSQWVLTRYRKIQMGMGTVNLIITAIAVLGGDFIIRLAFGEDYIVSATPFKILMVSYFFSGTFRMMSGYVLLMLHKINVNLYINLFEAAMIVLTNALLIKRYGYEGAAYATLIVTIGSSAISNSYLYIYLKKNIKDTRMKH